MRGSWAELVKERSLKSACQTRTGYYKLADATEVSLCDAAEIANMAPGVQEGLRLVCSYNRTSTATIFYVSKTAVMGPTDVKNALGKAFPTDAFLLYQANVRGTDLSEWAVALDKLPSSMTELFTFDGTGYGVRTRRIN